MPGEDASKERVFYGGTTKAEILDRSNDRIGIHHWAKEGITGQCVLLSFHSFFCFLCKSRGRQMDVRPASGCCFMANAM
jgi:hypothetical protein